MFLFRRFAPLFVATTTLAGASVAARAQDAGKGFLFGAPMGSFTVHAGWALARANSDLFSYTSDLLTLNRSDFSSPDVDADLTFRVSSRTEIVLSSGLSGT